MKTYKPTTPSRRHMSTVTYRGVLSVSRPAKALTKGGKRHVGRNNQGRITTRHKGGGHKRLFREIDFRYDKFDIPAKIETIEYDPNRSGFIALVCYADGERRYVLVPKSLGVGDNFTVSEKAPVVAGNRLPLKKIPTGTFVYNVEIKPRGGSKIARSAGSHAEVVANDAGYTHLKMSSSEIRKVPETAWACVGTVSNEEHKLRAIGKAGRSRWLGIRPTVRGSAMNPVDHPHGGGEGRSGRGRRRAVSMWGKPTGKGQKTRRAKKYSNKLILARRKVGKKRK
ncbi:MAG: 50S ribosomal protein L2 [Candidatus Yonathbacteria bacterium CG_4_10_14_3_um_filter_47_65]|uniref:Large ribosomal subunit protein uL2 n=1 Tax=Candidatus Nomurabacteria bacterium CG1_02_47_685 TaxID=1805282 RepID=A0A1J4VG03_9BACT|nr:MAG: 50S ribosomal protein L2 [Candidatus Nomurabacteria bacterium CG1_02_47_685]PIP04084.1 MAG: 50S ribosomal protein L2 [Candidatus Yonathbacteria bacterium CG23_combo_of_CG06-09_8_20_14_all_46_18]PIQ30937.1 MAG: 50S ribosomal protein L2 [Candidatus Yonathbacteria bacterium CG17_big_fil_post_rev_8_21_14_2_50_46_19]PIX56553.1 MAG: 50S ribosomal protein L2 [Candidatus Yonathbacteria bacterium CG_4_10_14_3_um_filter_47_65]PIY57280.1 MAG: 50S ribosomal protein L2 [Candidatus Yonathbacteria bac